MKIKKCPNCKKPFIEIEEGIFKPTCKCYPKDMILLRLKEKLK